MKYSNATSYALHAIVHMMMQPANQSIGVQELAQKQRLSPTYLSKILTKLTKSNLIQSTPGAKGGYKVVKRQDEISFLEVIHAIEGESDLFDCGIQHEGCMIENVMKNAETHMKQELASKKLIDIVRAAQESQLITRDVEDGNHSTNLERMEN